MRYAPFRDEAWRKKADVCEYTQGREHRMQTGDELSCQQVVELVTDYLENALLPESLRQLEAHVAECPGCKNYIEQMQLTIDMLHQIARESVFPATKQELLQLFHNWKKSSEAQETDSH